MRVSTRLKRRKILPVLHCERRRVDGHSDGHPECDLFLGGTRVLATATLPIPGHPATHVMDGGTSSGQAVSRIDLDASEKDRIR